MDTLYPTRSAPLFQAQLARTPWWMCSVAVHAVLLLIAYFVMFAAPPAQPILDIITDVAQVPEEPFDTEIPPPDDAMTQELPGETDAEAFVPREELADTPETDTNAEDHGDPGEPDVQGATPLDGRFAECAIGVGGGASGDFGDRGIGGRKNLGARGGSRLTEERVARGLHWLARHQGPDGDWSCDAFHACCKKNRCDGAGSTAAYTPGTTALALLAFLGEGNSLRAGRYKEVVRRACRHLRAIQGPDGCVGPKDADGHYLYNHAIATMALAEAYALSDFSPTLKDPAQRAVDYLLACQNPYAGWRYGMRPGDSDTSVTGWAVLALKSAVLAKLTVPEGAFAGARAWLDAATDESYHKAGYTRKADNGARLPEAQAYRPTEAMTAAAVASRIFMGADAGDPAVRGGAALLKAQPPRWEPETGNDFYYWYYGALAAFQLGGDVWQTWNAGLKQALVPTQRRGGDEDGSWDPCDAWGHAGGRVYATAINTLTLEIYYRYAKVLGGGQKAKRE